MRSKVRLDALEHNKKVHEAEITDLWDWCGRLDTKVSRLHDLADPVELEAQQRRAYKKLSDLQSKVEALTGDLVRLHENSEVATIRRLLDSIWEEIGLMKSQQEQTWALVQRAVIRP